MHKIFLIFGVGGFLLSATASPSWAQSSSPNPPLRDLHTDTWVGTDALGRTVPVAPDVRKPQPGKFVGIFYFVWHSRDDPAYDNTKAIAANPSDPHYGPVPAFHWWGEPAVGYFRSDDPWVARKNLQMLADAGVDVLFLDMTNAATYPKDVQTLFDAAEAMRAEGLSTPKIGFITHAHTVKTVTDLYNTYYAPGLYRNLWFLWEGKPLILGTKDAKDDGVTLPDTLLDFFTWRKSWAWDAGQDKWQWMDKYPQKPGWHTDPAVAEELPVVVAGHPTDNLGRSYQGTETWGKGTEPPMNNFHIAARTVWGDYFAWQWQRALQVDPQFIFITGWNEWVAQHFTSGAKGGPGFLGRALKPGETFFVDNYNEEFSRDIMPMQGGYEDDYYMQMVDGIRRFKGARALPVTHAFQTMTMNKPFSQWSSVTPQYLDAIGDTTHRDWAGWKGEHFTNVSGRNDITSAKVACDTKNIFFSAHTDKLITKYTDPHWMQLLLDTDRNPATGWHGYEYVVDAAVLSPTKTTLKRLSDGKTWTVTYRAAGQNLMIVVPRVFLGLTNARDTAFDFHWIDNVLLDTANPVSDLTSWWYQGDSAPDGRFNYRYINTR